MKVLSPRRIKAWLVAAVSLIAVTAVLVAPALRSRAQNPPTSYEITDLGTFSGGTESKAFSINDCGQIAGYATLGDGSRRPFFRPSGSLIDLGVLSGNGTANSVNNFGYVVGNSPTDPSSPRSFIWHDGEMKRVVPAETESSAEDINDDGTVVGWIQSAGGSEGTGGFEGFIWKDDNLQIISGSPSHPSPLFRGINNAGSIVGEDSNLRRGFIRRGGVFTDIPPFPGGDKSVAYAVSESDHVVGAAALDSVNTTMHAFIWTDAGLKDLGTLPGLTNSTAYNVAIVNTSVQVVGTSYNGLDPAGPSARAFVWQDENNNGVSDPGEMKDLTNLISPSDATWTTLQQARSINSSGQIVGFGLKTNGETHAFLLTPTGVTPPACPTPTPTPSPSPSPSPSPTPTPTPTPTPAISIVLEQGTQNAAAVDSVTCVRGPFRVTGENNFSGDQTTRVILLTSSLGTTQPNEVMVLVSGIPLIVEAVGPFNGIPDFNGSYVVVSLGNLRNGPTGNLPLTVIVGSATSNVAMLSITP